MDSIEKRMRQINPSAYRREDVSHFNTSMSVPKGWIQLTRPDSYEEIEFAIEQLEKRNKKYSTCKHADGRISVWVRRK
jgi:hypothetical protein